jgi:carbon monoxide dehydrogenase subunit G
MSTSNFKSMASATLPLSDILWNQDQQRLLMQGEILIQTQSHTNWGGAVTACMYVPLVRSHVWQQITDYPRWVQYFPDITKSEVISKGDVKRLYQAAEKAFLFLTAQVEIYLSVVEVMGHKIQFRMERGSFADFYAKLELKDMGNGTLLAYTVQATPNIPIPSIFVEQAMNLELPANLCKMRQVLCNHQ